MKKTRSQIKLTIFSVLAFLILNLPLGFKIVFLTSDVENINYSYSGGFPLQWYQETTERVCYDGCFNIIDKEINWVILLFSTVIIMVITFTVSWFWRKQGEKIRRFLRVS